MRPLFLCAVTSGSKLFAQATERGADPAEISMVTPPFSDKMARGYYASQIREEMERAQSEKNEKRAADAAERRMKRKAAEEPSSGDAPPDAKEKTKANGTRKSAGVAHERLQDKIHDARRPSYDANHHDDDESHHHKPHDKPHHKLHHDNLTWCTSAADNCSACNRSLALALHSYCPSEDWADLISPLIAEPKMLIFNVGANKGYNVNSFLRRFQRGWNTTNAAWCRGGTAPARQPQTMPGTNAEQGECDCGVCGACRSKASYSYGRADVFAIAVELMRGNYENLRSLFARFKVTGEVIHAAGGERPGTAYEPAADAFRVGTENLGIQSKGIAVTMVTVDQIMAERKLGKIDLLSIDAEGHDAPVLRGASKTLERRLAKVSRDAREICPRLSEISPGYT